MSSISYPKTVTHLCPTQLPKRRAVLAHISRFKGTDTETLGHGIKDPSCPSSLPYRLAVLAQIAALKAAKKDI